jgi:DNA-binding transcriptional ArsR family regulator
VTAPVIDDVFTALADPTRRRVFETLAQRSASSATTLASGLPVSRQAVVAHLAVLQRSELVTSRRAGREVLFSIQPERLVATASWMTTLASTWEQRMLLLKRMAEGPPDE